jgi:hypothetical protein
VASVASQTRLLITDALREVMARLRQSVAALEEEPRDAGAGPVREAAPAGGSAPPSTHGDYSSRPLPRVLEGRTDVEPAAPASATGGDSMPGSFDRSTLRLACHLLTLAYRSSYQVVFACVVDNERRLREALAAAARIRAAADEAAAIAVRQADALFACAVGDERHLREAQAAAARIRATAEEAAAITVRQAEEENATRSWRGASRPWRSAGAARR